ncbi:hypothetical protein [Phytohabitans suffuscus]|uniref:Uncharacterized protein n=1 Tax=Phytohabitans suffuscus TaxID=624315 RepID=A0A6F8YTD9_9ACTN|nr:hypothetical protein [Phytohabitans suffuscus]BCB89445.1 hypothetical protein Psuf_067580 [Phytohabitans suffuscus]
MRHRPTFAKAARRFVAVLGLAAALSSATMVAAPAAHASDGVGRTAGVVHAGEVGQAAGPPYAFAIYNGAAKVDCPLGYIWNRMTGGPSSVWNRRADGSYHYSKIASIGTGYSHDTGYSRSMDAFVWDPANTCRNLTLHHLDLP